MTAAEVHGSEIVPLYQKLYSTQGPGLSAKMASCWGRWTGWECSREVRGIWTIDRGGDRRYVLEPLLEREITLCHPLHGTAPGDRTTALQGHGPRSRGALAADAVIRPDYQHRERPGKSLPTSVWGRTLPLPGRKEKLLLVVVAGFGQEPLMLLTNLASRARDSEALWWIVEIYLTRWKIEETFRFLKQSYNLEDLRVLGYQRLQNLVALVAAAAYFAAVFLGQKLKLRLLTEKLLIISLRFFGIPPFRFYALAEGIRKALSQGRPPTCAPPPDTWPLQLFLAWHG